ncbi:MAG: maltose ABC transporter permease MalF [Bacteriovoracaceae bacterium]|nr:maltose ABC transporter permease MalF [Bacteriovoracaceae bacterium]
MTSKVLKLFLFSYLIAGLVLSLYLFNSTHVFMGVLSLVITVASGVIFFSKKAQAMRFMYPGLLTFVLFMILPIIFTVYIAFTNLSTGHFLSKERVLEILSSEKVIPKDAVSIEFDIFPGNPAVLVAYGLDGDYKTYLEEGSNIYNLQPFRDKLPEQAPLGPNEVFSKREFLETKRFVMPDGEILRYHRTDLLIQSKNRYILIDENTLKDTVTSLTWGADDESGYFKSGNETLAPGYYVLTGFKNFTSLFSDNRLNSNFFKVLLWTLGWSFLSVLFTFSFGTFLAIVINDKGLKLKSIYRVLFIIPYSIPFFISVLIFKGMMNKDFGAINQVLVELGFSKVPWLETPIMAKVSCLVVNLWLGFPYMFLVITGILQSIPESLYEAAKLDGAGRFSTFKNITLPLIMSAVGPLLVGSFAFNLNNFVGIYLLTGGGPPIPGATTAVGETDILISYTYRLAFEGGQGQNFGLASSIALFIFAIVSVLTLINFKLTGMGSDNQEAT